MKLRVHRPASVLLLFAACLGCAGPKRARSAPEAPPPFADSQLHVRLLWKAPVDLDVYLTDPTSETVYFANNPARSGSRLEGDVSCRETAGHREWIEEARHPIPIAGRYRVGVDFIDACGSSLESVEFRVTVDFRGARSEQIGRASLEVFQPIVLEFDLVANPDGTVSLSSGQGGGH